MKKNNLNKVMILLSILFFIIGTCLIIVNIINNDNTTYNYKIIKNNDFKIYLKDNNFYENNILNKNNKYDYYVSKSIDKIKINFNYKFNSNKIININYKYNITSQIVSNIDNEDKLIWNKNYVLKEQKEYKINSNTFNINDSIDIDYNYYNLYAKEYEEEYKIKTNQILKIYLNVTFKTNLNNKEYKDYIEIDIPLTDTYTSITNNYEKNTIYKIEKDNNYINYIIGSSFILISVLFIFVILLRKENKSNINLKKYKDYIIIVKNKPNIDNLNNLFVESFDNLIELAIINNTKIILYKNKKETNFYIILDNFVYTYTSY